MSYGDTAHVDRQNRVGDMMALRAWLLNVNPRPKWFEARLLKWSGLKPDEVNRTLNYKKGDEPLPAEQIGKLQDFMATYRAGGITEYDDSRIAEEPNQKQERILDRPGFERPVPEPNRVIAKAASNPVFGNGPAVFGTKIAPTNGTKAPEARAPFDRDAARWKIILDRFKKLDKPHGFLAAFSRQAEVNYCDVQRMATTESTLTNLDGKYDRIEAALALAEKGELNMKADPTPPPATPPMLPTAPTQVQPTRVLPPGVQPQLERRTAVQKLMEIRQSAAEVVEAVDAVLEEVRADLETLEKVRQLASR